MPIAETLLGAIANAAFSYVLNRHGSRLEDWAREKLGQKTTRNAFKEALGVAFAELAEKYPQWVGADFNPSFLEREGAPVLGQFLVRDGQPNASELAAAWADSLAIQQQELRTFYTRELEPVAADFLDKLAHQLKGRAEFGELFDSRAFEQTLEALKALQKRLGAEKATSGTRREYLRWLIDRNLYLDARGTFQTQRQVQVKLDDVYIALRAQRGTAPGQGAEDRLLEREREKERAALEEQLGVSGLRAEEIEDRRDLLLARHEGRLAMEKAGEVLELAEAVKRHERLVILGDPGSGKTTLLHYMALKHALAVWHGHSEAGSGLGNARFPLLMRIAEYAEGGTWKSRSLSDFLVAGHTLHDCPKSGLADLLETELARGDCLVLLDGLDEIVSADERIGVVKQIEDFVRHHGGKGNRFVITSRIAGYSSAPVGEAFIQYTVREMDEAQMRRFLERWCQAVEDAQTPDLSPQERKYIANREINGIMKAIQTSPGVRRLATNPLLLRILALIHRTGARLPQKRIELYKLAADTLARTWQLAKGIPELALVKDEYLTPMLSKLAYWMHAHKPTGVATEREVKEVLGEEWARLKDLKWDADEPSPQIQEEVGNFLRAVREHTGLFVERAPQRYGFMHLTFEEYYVARYLVARSRTRAKLIRAHLHDPRWEEPILLALGFVGLEYPAEASELLEAAILAEGEEAKDRGLTRSTHEDLLGRDYLFALRCLGDNIPVRAKLLKQLTERLANELLHHSGLARFQRYRQALEERLEYLGDSEGATQLELLLITALHYANFFVRSNAVESLGRLASATPEALTALVAALHDTDPVVRRYATEGLGQLVSVAPEALTALVAALHDADFFVRSNAAGSLGQLATATPEVLTALVAALHDADAEVRSSAAASLGRLATATPEVLTVLVAGLHDADAEVRYCAAEGLGRLASVSPEVIAILIEALHTSGSGSIGRDAALLLGQISQGDKAITDALFSGLLDEHDDVRTACAQALAQLGKRFPASGQEIESRLVRAMQDPAFDKTDRYMMRPAYDSAYDALWMLVVGEEIEVG